MAECASAHSSFATTDPGDTPPTTASLDSAEGVHCRYFFSGTGTSEGIPRISCLAAVKPQFGKCDVCTDAMVPGSKNRRRNTGALVAVRPDTPDARVFAIDVGKNSWDSLIDIYSNPDNTCLNRLDAVLLTHEHADACGGLDNLRDFTMNWWLDGDGKRITKPLPIYLTSRAFDTVQRMFPYMVSHEPEPAPLWTGAVEPDLALPESSEKSTTTGGVPAFRFFLMEEAGPAVNVCGMPVLAFAVNHGPTCDFTAFRLGPVIHMTDCKFIPEGSRAFFAGVDVAVVDVLDDMEYEHPSHMKLKDAIAEIKDGFGVDARPSSVWFVGMSHSISHDAVAAAAVEAGFPHAKPAFDGASFGFQWRAAL